MNASVYAVRIGQRPKVAIINKDESRTLELRFRLPSGASAALTRLEAARPDATEAVTLMGAQAGPRAAWRPAAPEVLPVKNGSVLIRVPAASAAGVTLA